MKKFLSILLSALLLTSALPVTAFAAEAEETVSAAESEAVGTEAQTYTDGDYSFIILDDGTAQITKYAGNEAELTVPAYIGAAVPVTQIGSDAFKENESIKKLTISEGITTIGGFAFYKCHGIQEISFASTVTDIGGYAFNGCTGLTSVFLPPAVKTTGDYTFGGCSKLSEISLCEGLEKMGYHFLAGTAVTGIYIPTTVTSSDEPFAQADSLVSFVFGAGITAIPDDMFEKCNTISSITIPSTVAKIGKDAFANMGALESIEIPDTVTELGANAFSKNKILGSVKIGSGVTKLPDFLFTGCTGLTQIDVPETVSEFGYEVFNNCTNLTGVTLHEGLVNFGSKAFAGSGITGITIPASVTKGDFPFDGCSQLRTVSFADGVNKLLTGMFYNSGLESVVIPEGVTTVPSMAFNTCESLTSVSFPSTLKTIGDTAFMRCTSLEEIDIPSNVETIAASAFYLDSALKTCTLHEGLKNIGDRAFRDTAITSVYIPKSLTDVSNPFGYSNITDVTFADGITKLPKSLFNEAFKLTDITIPDTVTAIGDRCFSATNIESIDIPDNVTSLGQNVFSNCDNLYAATIGAGVTRLPLGCFSDCDVLQNVIIPETVTSMEYGVFSGSGLYYQKLPDNIRSIPGGTFKNCKNLIEVECSDELESVGDSSFNGCINLTTLTTAAKSPSFYSNSFDNCPKFTDPRFRVFEPENTGIESTANIGTDHTLVHFTFKYDVRDDWKADTTMRSLILNLPKEFEIITSSFTAEGFDSSAVDEMFDRYQPGQDMYIDISNAQPTGSLRFSAYMNSSSDAYKNVTAKVAFWYKNAWFDKPLGNVQFNTSKLSIFAPSKVTDNSITVSGYTVTPDKDVTVTIAHLNKDGEAVDTVSYNVTPNAFTGKYTSEKLRILPEGKTAAAEDKFEVRAESNGNKSDAVSFTYLPGAVTVAKAYETVNIDKFISPEKTEKYFELNSSNCYDITGVFTYGSCPAVALNPKKMYRFRIRLDNDENISEVVLMSHRGDDWKFMQLYYDAATDFWIGEGYFDNNSHVYPAGQNYVPGALNLFYYYGERKDTYRSHYYGKAKDSEAVGAGFYYDNEGKPHGDFGNPGGTIMGSVGKAFIHGVTGKWNQVPSDVTVGGLKALWQWGNKNDNLFRTTHHGYAIDDYGNVVFPDDKADMLNRNAENDGRQCNLIDPSGIVYEAVEGNVIVGATATLYKLNEESGEWVEWNAADFEQQNPVLTNSEGAYAWLTDEGRFKVTISKDGYETQTSEEFDVPPEKLGLNFSLVDNTTHPSATVEKNEIPGAFTLTFNKYMRPDTVNADTIQTDGLENVSITPVYLNDGDEYADTFTVTGTPGKSEITFTVTDAAQSYSGVSAEAVTKTITIADSLSIGDVNLDGKITISDVTAIQRHIAEIEQLSEIRLSLADTNGDGEININDCTHLQKYIAEYEGIILGKQSAD